MSSGYSQEFNERHPHSIRSLVPPQRNSFIMLAAILAASYCMYLIVLSFCNDLNQHFILTQPTRFECTQCLPSSIPMNRTQSEQSVRNHVHGLYVDSNDQHCSTCQLGRIADADSFPLTPSRKLVFDEHLDVLYVVGSSTLRGMYINFVESFRNQHNFSNHVIIRPSFCCFAEYQFNGTNDVYLEPSSPRSQNVDHLENVLFSAYFIWNAELQNVGNTWQSMKRDLDGKNVMLLIGNHFWNYEFHSKIADIIDEYWRRTVHSTHASVIWLDTWYLGTTNFDAFNRTEENLKIQQLNEKATTWIRRQQHKHDIIQINLDAILLRDYGVSGGSEIFRAYKMTDGVHFQCSFKRRSHADYSEKIVDLDFHKEQYSGGCTDFIDDLLWDEIYRQIVHMKREGEHLDVLIS